MGWTGVARSRAGILRLGVVCSRCRFVVQLLRVQCIRGEQQRAESPCLLGSGASLRALAPLACLRRPPSPSSQPLSTSHARRKASRWLSFASLTRTPTAQPSGLPNQFARPSASLIPRAAASHEGSPVSRHSRSGAVDARGRQSGDRVGRMRGRPSRCGSSVFGNSAGPLAVTIAAPQWRIHSAVLFVVPEASPLPAVTHHRLPTTPNSPTTTQKNRTVFHQPAYNHE